MHYLILFYIQFYLEQIFGKEIKEGTCLTNLIIFSLSKSNSFFLFYIYALCKYLIKLLKKPIKNLHILKCHYFIKNIISFFSYYIAK